MRGEFKGDYDNNSGKDRKPNNPHITGNPILIDAATIDGVHANHKDHNGLHHSLHQPKEVVRIVEDGILLTNEIYFGKQTIKILVYLNV